MNGRVRAYIGLGSNLGDRRAHLEYALWRLGALPKSRLAARSAFYDSEPLDGMDQPRYLNAVAALDTGLAPLALLDALQAIEAARGRRRDGRRWASRTLDLDLLLYGDARIEHPRLCVPHPGLPARDFVLHPLAELAPDLSVPGAGPLAALLDACPRRGLERVAAP